MNGLYHETDKYFTDFGGYYSVTHILTLLAFMAAARIKTIEQIRKCPPGEMGKLLGIDRIPEVKCLRDKLAVLSENEAAEKWGEQLSNKWMTDNPELAGVLYVDGHVRLYGGSEKIPKQFVSRQRLCSRGFTDFWVNDMIGHPFFVVRQIANHGMLNILKEEIVPRLLKDVPNQPNQEQLDADPHLHRFIIVFDREGYSPDFFNEMWTKHRIACITYEKYPRADWSENEFEKIEVKLINHEIASMNLAERGTFVGEKRKGIWTRNIRKLTKSGHQTSIISTAYKLSNNVIATLMFARWCQEAFFKYMMENYNIDRLVAYSKEPILETEKIISSQWRQLEKDKNSLNGKLKSKKSRFADLTLNPVSETNDKKYIEWEKTKVEMVEEINILKDELDSKKKKQKETDKYIRIVDLPETEKFQQISPSSKNLVDTIKMISYRAETTMAGLITKDGGTFTEARALLQNIFVTEADLIPDTASKILTVKLHNLSTEGMNRKVDKLFKYLNESKIKYPGTNLLLEYQRIGN